MIITINTSKKQNQNNGIMEKENEINPVVNSMCETCMHYLKDKQCSAFWENIPDDIWSGKKEHNKVEDDQLLDVVYKEVGGLV
jgi:hypothetical protein